MLLVLVDSDIPSKSSSDLMNGNLIVGKNLICQQLLAYKTVQNLNDEDRAKKKVISAIIDCEDDVGSSIYIKWNINDDSNLEIHMKPCFSNKSVLKSLAQKFQEKAKISLYLEWLDACWSRIKSASIEGMKIDPETFTCEGSSTTVGGISFMLSQYARPQFHVKIVAGIDVAISKGPLPFAQKILEDEAFSDIIISAGNGAKIKAHKCFLSVCSDAFKAIFKHEMEESRTGLVDMSDLSEEGVKAFLRFVYHNDLQEIEENFQVAYDLLYAGHKYEVSSLWTEMKRILLGTKDEDFDVSVAFKTYMFTRNIESAVELKTKALQVLKGKWEELELLPEYNEFFEDPSNILTAREVFRDLAATAQPGCTCMDMA